MTSEPRAFARTNSHHHATSRQPAPQALENQQHAEGHRSGVKIRLKQQEEQVRAGHHAKEEHQRHTQTRLWEIALNQAADEQHTPHAEQEKREQNSIRRW